MINPPLIYEQEYHCWREGTYLGIATYTEDPNVGDAFIKLVVSSDGELVKAVWIPDKWELVVNSDS